jgi:hypothetical protein
MFFDKLAWRSESLPSSLSLTYSNVRRSTAQGEVPNTLLYIVWMSTRLIIVFG